jgi:hypothetical protein
MTLLICYKPQTVTAKQGVTSLRHNAFSFSSAYPVRAYKLQIYCFSGTRENLAQKKDYL